MKLIKKVVLSAAFLSLVAPVAYAEGGIEVSGAVDVLFGYQRDDANVSSANLGGTSCSVTANSTCNSASNRGAGVGQLGDFRGSRAADRQTFNFYVDQVELNLAKTFGENIRMRADIDFTPHRKISDGGSQVDDRLVDIEQAYVTANIPVGNGLELLVGKFNIPMGFESVDRHDNIALSQSNLFRYLKPQNIVGAKFYYEFSELIDLHFYVANNLKDTINNSVTSDNAYPSIGARLGFNWGEGDSQNTVGISAAAGLEKDVDNGDYDGQFTFMIDIDFAIHFTERFMIGGEVFFRQDNNDVAGNDRAYGANLLFAANFSDSFGAYLRGGYTKDAGDLVSTATYLGLGDDSYIIDGAVGLVYQIADGAKVKLEYRLDYVKYDATTGLNSVVDDDNSISHGVAVEFAYMF